MSSYERKEADYIEKLKKGFHSVRGIGKTQPDPRASKVCNSFPSLLFDSLNRKVFVFSYYSTCIISS